MKLSLSTAARLLFALPFAVFGVSHFLNASAMVAVVPLPGGLFWVYLTGAALIAGSAGIVTNIRGEWAAFGIALLMLTFVFFVHGPGLTNAQTQQMATIGMLKDLALCGGALTWAGIFARERRARESTTRSSSPLIAAVAPASP